MRQDRRKESRPAMDYVGIDLHKNSSQVCVLTEDGELIERRIKTDKRDARALCEACRLGAYRHAHRTSDRQRDVRAHLSVRESLIRTRSKYIALIGALARREGCRIKAGPSPSFARRVEQAGLPTHTLAQIEPLLVVLKALGEQIKAADKRPEEIARADEVVQRLCSVPGVGPVLAT